MVELHARWEIQQIQKLFFGIGKELHVLQETKREHILMRAGGMQDVESEHDRVGEAAGAFGGAQVVEARVGEEGRVADSAGSIVTEVGLVFELPLIILHVLVHVLQWTLEPHQIHVLEEHMEAHAQQHMQREGLVPHHHHEHLVQVPPGGRARDRGEAGVVVAHGACGADHRHELAAV